MERRTQKRGGRIRNRKRKERREFDSIREVREYIRDSIRVTTDRELPKGLPATERKKYQIQMQHLRYAFRACLYGDGGEKEYVKHYIMRELEKLELSAIERNRLLPIGDTERLTVIQEFRILLYRYMKQYGKDGFYKLCEEWNLPGEVERKDGRYYEITEEDIRRIYEKKEYVLSEQERMDLICEEIYEGFGHGVIDRLRDCRLEGVSGGVAGMPEQFFRYETEKEKSEPVTYAHDSIFVMIKGTTVRLSFLSFGSEQELRRVVKSLLRFEAQGELSYYRPYMVNDMKDGSRVFACRPPFSESWAFFVRKFDSTEEKRIEELIVGEGAEEIIEALRFFVRGGLHIAVTGAQGSGKTTLMKALVHYINPKYNLRIEESVFELWMRKEYPHRNILTFRETESVGPTEGLDAFRKTDGNCLMMGEIGNIQSAALMVELSQVSEQQLFTHHAMTTEKLLGYFRNALLRTGTYSDEHMAQEQVVDSLDIHVLCEKDLTGMRYIKEVSEIVRGGNGCVNMLYRYENGRYEKVGTLTEDRLSRMKIHSDKQGNDRACYSFTEVRNHY